MEKEKLTQILVNMRDEILNATEEEYSDSEWYSNFIYNDDVTEESEVSEEDYETEEDFLAIEAMKYPDLYPIVRNIIRGITEINLQNCSGPLDVDSEWAAGTYFATKLVETTKSQEDITLFSNHLKTRDLDHEESGEIYGVLEVFETTEYSNECIPVLAALFLANSQHRGEFFTIEMCEEFETLFENEEYLNEFLNILAKESPEKYALNEIFELILDSPLSINTDSDEEIEKVTSKFTNLINQGEIPTRKKLME